MKVRGSFAHMPRTFGLVWRSSKGGTLLFCLTTLLAAIVPLGIAYVGKRIVDAVVAEQRAIALSAVLLELALVAVLAINGQARETLRQVVGAKLGLDINVAILQRALDLELRHFEDPEFYDQLTRARREASSRPLAMVTRTLTMVQSLIGLLGYSALLLRFGLLAVVALLAAAVPATIAEMFYANKTFRLRNWRSPETRKLMYLESVLGTEEHAKEVKLFALGPYLLRRYRSLGESFRSEEERLAIRRAMVSAVLSLLATATFYGCYALMVIAAARKQISLGDMTLGMVAFRQGQQSFQTLLGAFGGIYEDDLYLSNLFSYLDQTPPPRDAPLRAPGDAHGDPAEAAEPPHIPNEPTPSEHATFDPSVIADATQHGIVFDKVGFRYPGRSEWALRNVTVAIPAGTSLALVGQNGAGKTTFIKLLTRLYRPTEGRILLDGRELGEWDEATLRARVGVVFQDFARYQFTARENVGLGDVALLDDETANEAHLRRAIERGGADDVIARLRDGLDTPLGRRFGGGVELSGGQWQKIALARAFVREGADILILDEPTAALDAEAEHAVFERFRELTLGKTSIVISHRFPSVRRADRIVVIERGQLLETGTHAQLLAINGRYADLFSLQAKGYL